jgi:hypothetical protein
MQVKIAIEADRDGAQRVALGVARLQRLHAAAVAPGRRRQHHQFDAQPGEFLCLALIRADYQRLADHEHTHFGIINRVLRVPTQPEGVCYTAAVTSTACGVT